MLQFGKYVNIDS